MFKVGMKVAHPMHGVGKIEGMEAKEVLGEQQSFYVLHLHMKNIRILVPVDKGEAIGLRKIHEEDKVEEIFGILAQKADEQPSNWNRRYKINLEKLKSGDIMEVASVLKNLEQRRQEKNLSSIEKKMYYDVRNILVGELVFSKNIKAEQAEKLIDQALVQTDGIGRAKGDGAKLVEPSLLATAAVASRAKSGSGKQLAKAAAH